MGLALFITFNVVLQELTGDAGAPAYAVVVADTLAVVVFTLPLPWMQARLKPEKLRLLSRTDDAIKATIASSHDCVNASEHVDVGELDTSLNALLTTRKVVASISTWPWGTDTVRASSPRCCCRSCCGWSRGCWGTLFDFSGRAEEARPKRGPSDRVRAFT